MEDHNNEKRPRQQGRSNYTRRAPRANNNNQNRKPGAPAPAASAPQAAAEGRKDAGAENIARQIEEKFHMKVDIE